jgi:hypothetical protein
LFAVALVINFASQWTERVDVGKRLRAVEKYETEGAYGNLWATVTDWLNDAAGVSTVAAWSCWRCS